MRIRELKVSGAFELSPIQHSDDRGVFLEWYRFDELAAAIGHPLSLRQANMSVSKRGVLRGVHFADLPLGQAKYVTVPAGAVIDFVIDLRVGSPTFGQWDSVLLDDVDRRAIYLSEGLGHAFLALSDGATVSYLVSDVYRPGAEHGVDPLDPEIGLDLSSAGVVPLLSPKDSDAPSLAQAVEQGMLPTWDDCQALYSALRADAI